MTQQWNGKLWQGIATPNPTTTENTLESLIRTPGKNGQIWACGRSYTGSQDGTHGLNTLVMRYS